MKNKIFNNSVFFFLVLIIPQISFSLDASISFARFKADQQSFVEISLQIIGQSVVFEKTADSTHYQASVDVFIRLETEGKVLGFEKYQLSSPLTKTVVDFIDLKRMALPEKDIELIVEIKDIYKTGNQFEYRQKLQLQDFSVESTQSDIQLFASCKEAQTSSQMSKQGFEFEILPYDVYHEDYNYLTLYNELYALERKVDEEFYVSAIVNYGYIGEGGETALKKHKKYTADPVNLILMQIDISDLVSGNYHLSLEVYDLNHSLISTKSKNFQRINTKADRRVKRQYNKEFEFSFVQKLPAIDLDAYLKMHRPLVGSEWASILNDLVKEGDEKSKRHFLFTLWIDEAPKDPEKAFLNYMSLVENANKMFYNNVGYGYETDRGHIYLKFGIPNDVLTVEDEPSAPPYEIWKYNFLAKTGQTDVKFLFYNPSLAYNDFYLLHSNCYGELNNPRWEITLYKNAPAERIDGDGLEMEDNFGRNARRYFHEF
jgi:GWxTD domain-containing protein